eukprot:gene19685-26372_t
MSLYRWLSFFAFVIRYKLGFLSTKTRGAQLVAKLQNMGVLFIKIGQILSVQYNFLDVETRHELRKLQDQNDDIDYRPFEVDGVTVEDKPFACGSIAHIYKGTHDGKPVVVKVLRNNVLDDFVATRRMLTKLVQISSWSPYLRKLGATALVKIIIEILETQLNFQNELANWRNMKAAYNDQDVIIPHMFEELCNDTVLVMEYVDGCSVYEMKQQPNDIKLEKGNELIRIFFHGLFKGGFMHGDCHAGNVFWSRADHKLGFYDFGIIQRKRPPGS